MNIRRRSTKRNGSRFSETERLAVWQKARPVVHPRLKQARVDACGAVIIWENYGETVEGSTGWEIDHIVLVARGGSDELSNLQPLQWQNNRAKGDSVHQPYCLVSKSD